MKYITFLSDRDWANVLTKINKCMQTESSKYKSICICIKKHFFNYNLKHEYDLSENLNVNTINFLKNHLLKSELIILGYEGQYFFLNILKKNIDLFLVS